MGALNFIFQHLAVGLYEHIENTPKILNFKNVGFLDFFIGFTLAHPDQLSYSKVDVNQL